MDYEKIDPAAVRVEVLSQRLAEEDEQRFWAEVDLAKMGTLVEMAEWNVATAKDQSEEVAARAVKEALEASAAEIAAAKASHEERITTLSEAGAVAPDDKEATARREATIRDEVLPRWETEHATHAALAEVAADAETAAYHRAAMVTLEVAIAAARKQIERERP